MKRTGAFAAILSIVIISGMTSTSAIAATGDQDANQASDTLTVQTLSNAGGSGATEPAATALTIASLESGAFGTTISELTQAVEAMQAALDAAVSAYDAAAADETNAKAERDNAAAAKAAADAAVETALNEKNDADAAVETARENAASAASALADAEAECDVALEEYMLAVAKKKEAQIALEDATAAVEPAQSSFDEAQATLADLEAALATAEQELAEASVISGTGSVSNIVDFYRSIGDDYDAEYFDYDIMVGGGRMSEEVFNSTHVGAEGDTTSFSNIMKSFDYLRQCNQIRANLGLTELRVTSECMAAAQMQLNWSDTNMTHSQALSVAENLSWGRNDPYEAWYTREKRDFERYLETYPELATMTSVQINRQYPDIYHAIGHYLNIINPRHIYTGFAISTDPDCRYGVAHGQTFTSYNSAQSYTVDEYEALVLNAFMSPEQQALVAEKQAAVDIAKANRDEGAAAVKVARQVLVDAQTAKTAAQRDLDIASNRVTDTSRRNGLAKVAFIAARSADADAKAALEAAQTEATAANDAYEAAQSVAQAKATDLETAQGIVDAAVANTASAAAEVASKQAALDDAQQRLEGATNLSNGTARVTPVQCVYTGQAQTPAITVSIPVPDRDAVNEFDITPADASVTWSNNVDAGTASFTVVPKAGSIFTGSCAGTFAILPASIENAAVSVDDQEYTGNELTPKPVVTCNGQTLAEDVDYTLAYSDNVMQGQASIAVTGIGNYTGTKSGVTFQILDRTTYEQAQLSSLIETVEAEGIDSYLEPDKQALQAAIDAAKALLAGGNATAEELEQALAAIKAAQETAESNLAEANKPESTITLANQTKTYNGKAQAYTGRMTSSGSSGEVTYTYYSNAMCTKVVRARAVKNAGTYYVKATVAPDANYKGATSSPAKLTILKAANTMTVRAKAVTGKPGSTIRVGKVLTVKKAQGKLAYKKVSGNKKVVVNAKTGKVTLKKGLKKGTYKVKIRVTCKGNMNYKAKSKAVSVKIRVK